MSRQEKNEEIAKILGFRQEPFIVNGRQDGFQWIYPREYSEMTGSTPCFRVPDFIELLDWYLVFRGKFKSGL